MNIDVPNTWWAVALLAIVLPLPVFVAAFMRSRYFWGIMAVWAATILWAPFWLAALFLAVFLRTRKIGAASRTLMAVVLMVGLLQVFLPSAHAAQTYTDGYKFTQRAAVWPHPTWYWMRSSVTWTVKTARECNSLYPCFGNVTWSKDKGEGIYEFRYWFDPIDRQGTNANGTKWKSRTIGAQFRGCIVQGGINVCTHENAYIKLLIKANGQPAVVDVWTS